jgi:hypothetical protein
LSQASVRTRAPCYSTGRRVVEATAVSVSGSGSVSSGPDAVGVDVDAPVDEVTAVEIVVVAAVDEVEDARVEVGEDVVVVVDRVVADDVGEVVVVVDDVLVVVVVRTVEMTKRVVEVVVLMVGRVVAEADEIELVDRRDEPLASSVVAEPVMSSSSSVVGGVTRSPVPGTPSIDPSPAPTPGPSSGSNSMVSRSLSANPSIAPVVAVDFFLLLRLKILALEPPDVSLAGWETTPSSSSSVGSPSRSLERAVADNSVPSASGPAGFSAPDPGAPLSTEVNDGRIGPRWMAITTRTISRTAATTPQS